MAIPNPGEGGSQTTAGRTDTTGRFAREFLLAVVLAVIAAFLVARLSPFLERYSAFVSWSLAVLFFAGGVFLIIQVIRGSSPWRLRFAAPVFAISTVFVVTVVPSTPRYHILEYSSID